MLEVSDTSILLMIHIYILHDATNTMLPEFQGFGYVRSCRISVINTSSTRSAGPQYIEGQGSW